MTDVDAVRLLASEHNLEFVDLDSYNVDPSVSAVLPHKVATAYHVVPIGRKFGAPVIAIGDPADVMAIDTLRAAIGREFISVVARPGQIAQCIDRVYQGDRPPAAPCPAPASDLPAAALDLPAPPPDLPAPPPAAMPASIPGMPDPVSAALDDALGRGLPTAPVAAPSPPRIDPGALGGSFLPSGAVPPPPSAHRNGSGGRSNGHGPRDAPSATASAQFAAAAGSPDTGAGSPGTTAGAPGTARDGPGTAAAGSPGTAGDSGTPGALPASPELEPAPFGEGGSSPQWSSAGDGETGTGAAGLLPPPPPPPPSPPDDPSIFDETAADLVDEAVAQFEEQAGPPLPAGLHGELVGFPPLARVLVEGGRVPIDTMREALFEQERTGQSLARTLTMMHLVTEADLMWGMAHEMGLEFVDLEIAGVDLTASYALPESTARHHGVAVIGRRDGVPLVATANPTNVLAGDDLRTILGRHFVMVVATRTQISAYLDRAYNQGGSAAEAASSAAGELGQEEVREDLDNLQAVVDDAPIVRYVNLLVLQALNERASDIHVEPTAENLRIRYRIDGVLHDMSTAPRSIAAAVTTRLKVMADMNIAEHRIPQDGRISLKVGTRSVDLRVATLPTIYGEKIVMRVLDKSNVVLSFEELGFDSDMLSTYQGVYTKPYGTILVTGPTGSGKTTTLYATLSALNSPEKNIITVEDPVELRIKGINQVQLNLKAGLTFASALRSILRADPDIVLVGEIRDRETALISVEAALTGHLVLATLHTNDAASTPMRLVEMGIEPYLVSSAATAVLAQRLARRLCAHCKEPFAPTDADIAAAGWQPQELADADVAPTLYRAVGCSACAHTGYRGRKALVELLMVTEEVERMIIEGGSADDIHRLAVEQGMVTLRQSGVRRALEGETTLEEVLRVVA